MSEDEFKERARHIMSSYKNAREARKNAQIDVTVICGNCGYEEVRTRGRGESFEGSKCPNCDEHVMGEKD